MKRSKGEMRDEYPAELIRSGVRGKFASDYRQEANAVVIDPDLRPLFPDSATVNRALRDYVAIKAKPKARPNRNAR
jgi:hypothetical protein